MVGRAFDGRRSSERHLLLRRHRVGRLSLRDFLHLCLFQVSGTPGCCFVRLRHEVILAAACRSGNGRISEVTLRRARLVLGWVTVFGG